MHTCIYYICSTCSQSALFVIGIPLLWHPLFVCVLPRPCWAEEKLHDEVQSFCHAFPNSHGRSLAWLVCGFLLKTKGCVLPVVKQHKTDINQDEALEYLFLYLYVMYIYKYISYIYTHTYLLYIPIRILPETSSLSPKENQPLGILDPKIIEGSDGCLPNTCRRCVPFRLGFQCRGVITYLAERFCSGGFGHEQTTGAWQFCERALFGMVKT